MYDSNKTMRKIGRITVEELASDEAKEEIIEVLKAHRISYLDDIREVMHLAIDLYALGLSHGKEIKN